MARGEEEKDLRLQGVGVIPSHDSRVYIKFLNFRRSRKVYLKYMGDLIMDFYDENIFSQLG